MEALIELCDLIAENPVQFSEKLSWICGRCPPPESLLEGSPRVSRSQLNAVLAVARFLSRCQGSADLRPKSVVIEFLRFIPASFNQSFWPQSFGNDAIASFFADFLGYVSKASKLSTDFSTEIAGFTGDVVVSAISNASADLGISRAFLTSLSQSFPPISDSDAERLVNLLLDQLVPSGTIVAQSPATPRGQISANSETSSSQSSPLSLNHFQPNGSSSPGNEVSHVSGSSGSAASRIADDATSASSRGSMMMNGGSILWKSGIDQLGVNFGFNDGGGAMLLRQQVSFFEEESVESLEKQEIAFKMIAHILEKCRIDTGLLEQVRFIAKRQLQSLTVFLKVRSSKLLLELIHYCNKYLLLS